MSHQIWVKIQIQECNRLRVSPAHARPLGSATGVSTVSANNANLHEGLRYVGPSFTSRAALNLDGLCDVKAVAGSGIAVHRFALQASAGQWLRQRSAASC